MKVIEIFEARRNPHLNPKSDFVAEFYHMYSKYRDKLYLSFTQLNKLGINPNSHYNTPIGVYAYPANYVKEILERKGYDTRRLPFAGENPYVQFIEARGNGLDLDKYDYRDLKRDLSALFRYVYKTKLSDEILEAIIDNRELVSLSKTSENMESSLLWTFCFHYSQKGAEAHNDLLISKVEETIEEFGLEVLNPNYFNKKMSINWNTILNRIMGYDYVTDSSGFGLIHSSEPTQAVFLSNRGYKHVGTYELGNEGARNTAEKYQTNKIAIKSDTVFSYLKKDFPYITKDTKIIYDPNVLISHKTLEERIQKNIEVNESWGDLSENGVIQRSLKVFQKILIIYELFKSDFDKNANAYKNNDIPTTVVYDEFSDKISGNFENKRHQSDYVEIVREHKQSMIEQVHDYLEYYYGVSKRELK